ncbi:MAG: nucleotidyl transferase AbiEii/AbiGii toxin family protein [Thermoplasmataceae archaeon]
MKIPIANQLKKRQQVEIASLQDELISLMYAVSDDLILHGGTAIWRCFSGKRFSEDLDFYSISFPEKLMEFEKTVRTQWVGVEKGGKLWQCHIFNSLKWQINCKT